jgi:hypothetical protein
VYERYRVAVVIRLPLDEKMSRNMSFFTQFARFGQRRPLTPARRMRHRPTLEALETRNLLSTLTVTNHSDTGVSGDGSLRGEIAAAAKGDQIVFAKSLVGQAITLDAANGPLLLDKDLTISGPGADKLTISGNDATQVFSIASGASDTIQGLTIADGNADNLFSGGGGILNNGTLTLDDSTVSGNHADGFVEGGGGIANFGTLMIDHSTLSGNHADGGIFGGGGIANSGTLTIDHSAVFGNHADGVEVAQGGGIFNVNTMTIDHTAVFDNHADGGGGGGGGGGIFNDGIMTLEFSAVFGNSADIGADLDDFDGSIFTVNHSFVGVRFDDSDG